MIISSYGDDYEANEHSLLARPTPMLTLFRIMLVVVGVGPVTLGVIILYKNVFVFLSCKVVRNILLVVGLMVYIV